MNRMIQSQTATSSVVILVAFSWIWVVPKTGAVTPPSDGCYPGFTTAEGCNALGALTSGVGNTGVGWESLHAVTTGSYNTGVGAGTLILNTGDSNTAVGTVALLLNTTGTQNTAVGTDALVYNDTGNYNTAVGYIALESNTTGVQNCALGWGALHSNSDAINNTAVGVNALGASNADDNTAVGYHALYINTGASNTAVGSEALSSSGNLAGNTALGAGALSSLSAINANSNTAIGNSSGLNITGSRNICIGADVFGQANVDDRTWIANVYADVATDRTVYVAADGHLGTLSSSQRYKEQIKPMDGASETLFALRPVTFRYKKDVDPRQARSFGLVAEEVAEVNPDLITRDKEGKPQTVRYDAVNAMLLNEFLKEHRKVQEQEATIAQLKKDMENVLARVTEHDSKIQQASDQIKLSGRKSRVVSD
jgi:endosialidase-like protein